MASIKPIKDWNKILLDTTVICHLLLSQKPGATDECVLFAAKLLSFLAKNKSASGERTFYITSLTVSEIITNENDSEKIRKFLNIIDSKNVEFIDFDLPVSLSFNSQLYPHLLQPSLNSTAQKMGLITENFKMAREWIIKDYMIMMCGVTKGVDAILTSDKKTFYPLSKNVSNSNCVLVYPELFEQSEQFILKYHENKVEDFIKPKPKAPKVTKPKKQVAAKPNKTTIEATSQQSSVTTATG